MGIREEFEKLNEIRDSLSEYIVFIGNTYTTPNPDFYDLVNWLNGAWYAFQGQQKKIDAVIDYIKKQERADEYMTGIVDTDGLKDLLK